MSGGEAPAKGTEGYDRAEAASLCCCFFFLSDCNIIWHHAQAIFLKPGGSVQYF